MSRPGGFTARVLRALIAVAVRTIYAVPALLFVAAGKRLIRLTHPDRIGHLAAEVDCLLKEVELGLIPRRDLVLLAPDDAIANRRLADYWGQRVEVVRSPAACRLLAPMHRFKFARACEDITRYAVAINDTPQFVAISRQWGERPPLLSIPEDDTARGQAALRKLGIEPGAAFVCFHNREGGYFPEDEHLHSFRNASIANYLPAMRMLAARGIHCVRLGDPSMQRLPAIARVIDYAHSGLRADWLDLFLCANCTFFVGNTSGLFLVPFIFGVPCCLANLVPFSAAPAYGRPHDLGIPKLLWSEREGRLLSFPQILASPIGDFRFSELYSEHGVRPIENTPQEIQDVVLEMLERVEGRAAYTPKDQALQETFRALLRPGHNAYGGASRVGRDFLRKYEHLLGD